jgi:Ion transport protein
MYDGMRTTQPVAALYFLFIFIIGNYVMLNLFLAILLDQFAAGDAGAANETGSITQVSTNAMRLPPDKIIPKVVASDGHKPAEHIRQITVAEGHATVLLTFHVR